jgi:acyl carrier protein
MTPAELEKHVRGALYAVAPDLEGEPLDPDARYRDQFDFDSMDLLRYVMELHRRTGIEVPETDYRRVESLGGAMQYLGTRSP